MAEEHERREKRQSHAHPQPQHEPAQRSHADDSKPQRHLAQPALPRGGGAIRGIGEKFRVSPATGTASFSIPVSISPGRTGFGPSLALGYDSGSGHSLFGLGWSVGIPSIRRKTDKGLPAYRDAVEGDVFVFSGAEDLVPIGTVPDGGETLHRYRPRVEGAYARIERITGAAGGDYWRVITRDNVTNIFGREQQARIADPDDDARVFEWLLQESFDDHGNRVTYEYAAEDLTGVAASAHERHRRDTHLAKFVNRHIKRIRYGNQTMFDPAAAEPPENDWHFIVVFDYGDHDDGAPTVAASRPWSVRPDPFSSYRSTFEVRTYRLCRRILMFHRFAELGADPVLVRSTDLTHALNGAHTFLSSVVHAGYIQTAPGVYQPKAMPPVEMSYTPATIDERVQSLPHASLEGVPAGLDETRYRWVDLDGEALSGLLTQQGDAWWYKRNEGDGVLAPPRRLPHVPSQANLSNASTQLVDLRGSGTLGVVDYKRPMAGYSERIADDDSWSALRTFTTLPNIDFQDPSLRFIDLDGDGHADVLITEEDVITWYRSLTTDGFEPARAVPTALDEERGARVVFADRTQSIYIADMSGDGLSDLVRIRNGEVCYWPNLGFGRFGAKVTMSDSPHFDLPSDFEQRRIRLADVDGSGTTDIVYLTRDGASIHINESGNAFAPPRTIRFPIPTQVATVSVIDLLGTGTGFLVWSSPAPGDRRDPWRFVDLLSSTKPYLLESVRNNLGAETVLDYVPSTRFYLEDRRDGRPWLTRLPFVVHLMHRVTIIDHVMRWSHTARHTYHHGYYDGVEREFRGFGRVDEWSVEGAIDAAPPDQHAERRVTWFHTGAPDLHSPLGQRFRSEYWNGDALAWQAQWPPLPAGLSPEEERQAARALKGHLLRKETYGEDGTPAAAIPYAVEEQSYTIELLQHATGDRYASFSVREQEGFDHHYERDAADPRIGQEITIEADAFGNVTKQVSVAYPRRVPAAPALDEQAKRHVTFTTNSYANVDNQLAWRRIGVPVETCRFELTGIVAAAPFHAQTIIDAIAAAEDLSNEKDPTPGTLQSRLLGATRHLYYRDDLAGALPLNDPGRRAIPYETLDAAFTPGLLTEVYDARLPAGIVPASGYMQWPGDVDGLWWRHAARQEFDAGRFFLAIAEADPFGNRSTVEYDAHSLLVTATHDALPAPRTNSATITNQYRVLVPWKITDPNQNVTAVRFDPLCMVTATFVRGRVAGEGDSFDDTTTEASAADDPTTKITYDLDAWRLHGLPCSVKTEVREKHGAANPRWQTAWSYSDGHGHEVLKKIEAEAGLSPVRGGDGKIIRGGDGKPILQPVVKRWVGTGRVILNNKGNPVRRYEPYFAPDEGFDTEDDLVMNGVSATLIYDPLDRTIRTDQPNGTLTRVDFSAWHQETWDENDTVLTSDWRAERIGLPAVDPEKRALTLSEAHANTPGRAYFDSASRAVVTVSNSTLAQEHLVRTTTDVEGHQRAIKDANGVVAVQQTFDMLGRKLFTISADSGENRLFPDCEAKTTRSWEGIGAEERMHRALFDEIDRGTQRWCTTGGVERLMEWTIFGELHPNAVDHNLKGRVYRRYDGAGSDTTEDYDFKGNVSHSRRVFAKDGTKRADWTALDGSVTIAQLDAAAAPLLDPGAAFDTRTEYDALNRVTQLTHPDGSIVIPTYNEANLMETMSVRSRGAVALTPIVTGVDYDAKGQRREVVYSNNITSTYEHDPRSFRLTRILSHRAAAAGVTAATVQDLHYTYDAVGNIVEIRDDAQRDVFFDNDLVTAQGLFEYDALYRIARAEGREHAGAAPVVQPDAQQVPMQHLPHNNDMLALRRYVQLYEYDLAGNITKMRHQAGGADFWTRVYQYAADSNRLLFTSRPGDPAGGPYSSKYTYDSFGNMKEIPGFKPLDWNEHDELQDVDLGGGGTAQYTYDSSAKRARKLIVRLSGQTEERFYVGDYEIFRRRDGGGALQLERETVHVLDGLRRVVMIETKTVDGGVVLAPPQTLFRYRLENHLGSCSMETDASGLLISYEEYYPWGETSYRSANGAAETNVNRYRHHGKERDDETGLYYYGARYYLPWLGRWTAPDPAGSSADLNSYAYVHNNPIALTDPSGAWPSLRTIAIVAAVVVVGTVVTIATAGVAGPIIAGAVASVGLSGAAATVATGVVVGAVAGAAGGAASELTRQAASGERISGSAIGRAALHGAAFGAITGGIAAGAGAAASAAASSTRVAAAASRAGTVARAVASRAPAAVRTAAATAGRGVAAAGRTLASGARAVAQAPGVRQVGQAIRAIEQGSTAVGVRAAARLYGAGSQGASAAAAFAATRGVLAAGERGGAFPAGGVGPANLTPSSVARLERAVRSRAAAIGIKEEEFMLTRSGRVAFNPEPSSVGGNVPTLGIEVDAAVLRRFAPADLAADPQLGPAFAKLGLGARIEATLVHEHLELAARNAGLDVGAAHLEAVAQSAGKFRNALSQAARDFLDFRRTVGR